MRDGWAVSVTPLPEQPLTADQGKVHPTDGNLPGTESIPEPAAALLRSPSPAWLAWLKLTGLRGKLILPYAVLTLLTAAIGIFVVMRLVASSARERFQTQLVEASRVAGDGIVRRESEHLESLRLMAFAQGIVPAVQTNDQAAVEALLGPLVLNNRMDLVTITDRKGIEIMTFLLNPDQVSYTALPGGADLSENELVAKVLSGQTDELGDKYAKLDAVLDDVYLFTSAPIQDETEQIAGVVIMGSRLETVLDQLKEEQSVTAEIIILDTDGKKVDMTRVEPNEGVSVLEISPGEAQDLINRLPQAASNEEVTLGKDVTLDGRPYKVLYAPLVVRQQPLLVLGVILPYGDIFFTEIDSRNQFALIFTLGTACVIIIGYLIYQNIARPILRLRQVSQAVAGGDLEQRTEVKRTDEIGELASAFDSMTDRLKARTMEARRLYDETVQRNLELKETNHRLQTAQQQLIQSEKLAAVGQLTAGIVHDVKNPLAVIKGLAEILQEEAADAFAQEQLTLIRDNASRANTIVSDLLKFARQSTPEMMTRDLRETVQASVRLTEYLARKNKVTPTMDLPDEPLDVTYDAQQIEQVLINLIQNAVQAMPGGGTLNIQLASVNGQAIIKVQDTGTGISPDNLNRIFDPFFTTKPEGEGTGLGLSVSYGIITRHRGEIMAESVMGQGTTFIIKLPVTQPESNGAGETYAG